MLDIKKRNFLKKELILNAWVDIQSYFDDLNNRDITNVEGLRRWFQDRSELEAFVSEDLGWRYIRMTCYTEEEKYTKAYQDFVENIQPKIAPESDKLNNKALASPFLKDLESDPGYDIMIREMKKEVELFREENIPLFTQVQTLAQKYSQIMGGMFIVHDGKELTLQQAGVLLQENDRALREEIYRKVGAVRLESADELEDIFDQMVKIRHQIALNCGFDNFRDYMFKAMGRFDYTSSDCFDFHTAVKEEVVPFLKQIAEKRKNSMKLDSLRPWDKAVDPEGRTPLKPFTSSDELLAKTVTCFKNLDSYFSGCLLEMEKLKHLDLASRKGKAPGGYNYPLAESGVPFIFMNATSTLRDMVTLLHEGGHAVHSFLTQDLELTDFKSTPSEVAELASMSMELLTMDFWNDFFNSEDDLKRAKLEHLEQIIETLPWVATIDKYQHWIYENHNCSKEERTQAWLKIFDEFSDNVTDWNGLETFKEYLWHRQLHLFEVPFYYIEYGMAQLGAVAVWKNYKENPEKGLEGYKEALKLGYTRTIPEIYKAAHINFDFSRENIKSLMGFVQGEIDGLS